MFQCWLNVITSAELAQIMQFRRICNFFCICSQRGAPSILPAWGTISGSHKRSSIFHGVPNRGDLGESEQAECQPGPSAYFRHFGHRLILILNSGRESPERTRLFKCSFGCSKWSLHLGVRNRFTARVDEKGSGFLIYATQMPGFNASGLKGMSKNGMFL